MTDAYQLGYRWTIEGPIDTVFHFVSDARTFHEWFGVFKRVESDDPDGPVRVGSHSRMKVRALLPYTLDWDVTVSRLEPPCLLHRLEQQGGIVTVINEQELIADRPLPGLLHPLAQAIFNLNHEWAMGRARDPLQRAVRRATASLA
jgi:hypothetical protein